MISEKFSLCENENTTLNSQMSQISVSISFIETESMLPNEEPFTSEGGRRKLTSFWGQIRKV